MFDTGSGVEGGSREELQLRDSGGADSTPGVSSVAPVIGAFAEVDLARSLLDRLPDITFFVFDEAFRYVFVAGAAFSRLGWREEDVLGRTPSDLVPPDEALLLEGHFAAALAGETRFHEHVGIRRDDIVWFSTISPLVDATGSIVGGAVVSRDVAEIRRLQAAERYLGESALELSLRAEKETWQRERLEFLNEINRVLAGTTDRRDVMRAVTKAAVPRLGDWCSIYVFFEQSDAPEVEVAHVDEEMVEYARELQQRFPYDPNGLAGVPLVIRTGESEFVSDITDELLAEVDAPSEAVEVVRQLHLRSVITVPLIKRRRVIGAMQFVLSEPNRHYDPDDLTLAEAMAGRVASSLDNFRLMEQQKEIADTLQRSLLPAFLPDIPGVDYAVSYRAGGEGAEVGGDFYDVFEIGEDRYEFVIGDVCGSGPHAAALTSLARYSVRANAWRGDRPAEVLTHVNDAIRRTVAATFCTLVVGEVWCGPDGTVLTIANGGHPPVIVVPASGPARATNPMGPLVGVFENAKFGEETIRFNSGDSVVLYTDGVTDLPPPNGLDTAALVEIVDASIRGSSDSTDAVARLSSNIDRRTPFSMRHDDVALLVLRRK